MSYLNYKIYCGKKNNTPDQYSKIYLGRKLVSGSYVGEAFNIKSDTVDLPHIDLVDYIYLEETIFWQDNYDWEYDFTNDSDRVVHVEAYMWVDDSDGTETESNYSLDVQPGDNTSFYIASDDDMISHAYIEVVATAVNASDFYYEGGS